MNKYKIISVAEVDGWTQVVHALTHPVASSASGDRLTAKQIETLGLFGNAPTSHPSHLFSDTHGVPRGEDGDLRSLFSSGPYSPQHSTTGSHNLVFCIRQKIEGRRVSAETLEELTRLVRRFSDELDAKGITTPIKETSTGKKARYAKESLTSQAKTVPDEAWRTRLFRNSEVEIQNTLFSRYVDSFQSRIEEWMGGGESRRITFVSHRSTALKDPRDYAWLLAKFLPIGFIQRPIIQHKGVLVKPPQSVPTLPEYVRDPYFGLGSFFLAPWDGFPKE